MKLKKITNPVFYELLHLNLINKLNIRKITNKCRDKKVAVYKDKINKIIFLEKHTHKLKKYYNYKNIYKTHSRKKFKKIDINKKIYIQKIDDDKRRIKQFQNICKNKEVLDFGCGWGDFIINLKKTKKKFAYEIRHECIKHLRQKKLI